MYSCSLGVGFVARVSAGCSGAPASFTAAPNKLPPDPAPTLPLRWRSVPDLGGKWARRGRSGGGDDLVEAFVLWPRRRAGACSGAGTWLWSVYRSRCGLWALDLQVIVGAGASSCSMLLSPAQVVALCRSGSSPACLSYGAEDGDFPSSTIRAHVQGYHRLREGAVATAAAARRHPASVLLLDRLPRVLVVNLLCSGGALYHCKVSI